MELGKVGAVIGILLILGLIVFLFVPREWFSGVKFNVGNGNSNAVIYNETSFEDESYTGLLEGFYVGTFNERVEPIMEDVKIGIGNFNGIVKIAGETHEFSGLIEEGYFKGRVYSGTPDNNSWVGNISGTVTGSHLMGTIRIALTQGEQPKQNPNIIYLLMFLIVVLVGVFLWLYLIKQEEQKKYYVVNVVEADKIARPLLRDNYDIYVKKLLRGRCYPHDKPQVVKLGYTTIDNRFCITYLRFGEIIDVNTECSAADFKKEFDEKGIIQTFDEKNTNRNDKGWHDKTKKTKPTSRVDEGYIAQKDEPEGENKEE